MTKKVTKPTITALYKEIKEIIQTARTNAYKAVNFTMVEAYWNVGRVIVEYEQKGKKRADYGKFVIENLSKKLTKDFGKGFSRQNLWYMRQFYLLFSNEKILHAVRRESNKKKQSPILHALRGELSWTHYRSLLSVEDNDARNWYMNEAADCGWNTRQLDRHIGTLYYERLLMSKDRRAVRKEANQKMKPLTVKPEDLIKDPYMLEFLNMNPDLSYLEKEIEQALLDKLQQFILELGKGFAFVERQQRISSETKEFYIDLVFYNYLLKCFFLIDLKVGELSHQDIGQIDMYVRYYEDKMKLKGDNPTIGLILCSKKDKTVVKYSALNDSKQLYASKYKLYLPTKKELAKEIERERALIERESKGTQPAAKRGGIK